MNPVWSPLGPRQFTDKRTRLTGSGLVHQNVRAYHGVIVRLPRQGERKGQITDVCFHAHNKPSAARQCAVEAANRLNKALTRGEDWAWREDLVK